MPLQNVHACLHRGRVSSRCALPSVDVTGLRAQLAAQLAAWPPAARERAVDRSGGLGSLVERCTSRRARARDQLAPSFCRALLGDKVPSSSASLLARSGGAAYAIVCDERRHLWTPTLPGLELVDAIMGATLPVEQVDAAAALSSRKLTRGWFGTFLAHQRAWQRAYDAGSNWALFIDCLLYTSPSPRDQRGSRMPSSA